MAKIADVFRKNKPPTHLVHLTDLMLRNRREALALMYKALAVDKRKISLYKLMVEIEEEL